MSLQRGRARLIAFRVVAAIGAVLHVLPMVFLAASFTTVDTRIHVVHNAAGSAMFTGVIALGWILAAVSPERMIAPFQAATLAAVAVAVAAALAVDLTTASITVALAGVLFVLHPARPLILTMGRTAPLPLALAALAALPAIGFALSNASLQRNGPPMDPHVEMQHWTGMAAFGLTAVTVGLVAGLGGPNRRIVAMVGGSMVIFFAMMSLAYSGYPGAVSTPWAIASLIWGAALAGDGYRMAREPAVNRLTSNAEPA